MDSTISEMKLNLGLIQMMLGHRLNEQRIRGELCDVKLCIGQENWMFDAHKSVLAAFSPYFEGTKYS